MPRQYLGFASNRKCTRQSDKNRFLDESTLIITGLDVQAIHPMLDALVLLVSNTARREVGPDIVALAGKDVSAYDYVYSPSE